MKRLRYYFFILLIISISSCKTKSTSFSKDTAVNNPCRCYTEKESNIISYSAVGESIDEMYSKTKALSDARIGLASLVQSKVLSIGNKFQESDNLNRTEELKTKRREATRLVVEQSLSNMKIVCEETIKTETGTYKTYICLEVKVETIEKAFRSFHQL